MPRKQAGRGGDGLKAFRAALVALLAALAVAGGGAGSAAAPAPGVGTINLESVASGLDNPIGIANAGDGSGRLFVILQEGQIVIYDGAGIPATPFLDITALVSCCTERGLLGLAFHPDYESNGYFYVDYTDDAGDTVVARYSVSGDPNVADAGSAQTVLTIDQPFPNHNGGDLHFGPDGYLYIASGDGGSAGDPQGNGQSLNTLLGKLLRIDVDSGSPYAIPPDNPFVGQAGVEEEIWAYGLRNPWRFSFDRLTGDLIIGDVGQGSWEEIDFQPASSDGGENYGWRLMEGLHCFDPPTSCDDGSLTLPILEYDHSGDNCSVTGGYRYRGSSPALQGRYLYADFCSGLLWAATEVSPGSWVAGDPLDTGYSISAFGEAESGDVYLTHRDANGELLRVTGVVGGVGELPDAGGEESPGEVGELPDAGGEDSPGEVGELPDGEEDTGDAAEPPAAGGEESPGEVAEPPAADGEERPGDSSGIPIAVWGAIGGGVALALIVTGFVLRRRRAG